MIRIMLAWRYDDDEEEEETQQEEDDEPIRVMAETPHKIYQEAHWKAATLQRTIGCTQKVLADRLPENH